jgi:ribonuclease Z
MMPDHLLNDNDLQDLLNRLKGARRLLFWGARGSGKSTLAMALGPVLAGLRGGCQVLSLDPGTPPFGVPGAVCRGWWAGEDFHWGDLQALCSLDAGRFRLPLLMAALRLARLAEKGAALGPILIEPPMVVRGVGAAELLVALVETLSVDALVVLTRPDKPLPLEAEFTALPCKIVTVSPTPEARRQTRKERHTQRTRQWERYLAGGEEASFSLGTLNRLGTPPPLEMPDTWVGRQVGLLDAAGTTLAMGEVIHLAEDRLTLQLPPFRAAVTAGVRQAVTSILIRNAGRSSAGQLATFAPMGNRPVYDQVPVEMTPQVMAASAVGSRSVSARVGSAWATLVGGVLGDPLLHVRLRHRKESLLFDLGDAARLSARVAHQVRAIFLSHAHLDHIGGFIWFLRSRIGSFGPCGIFGPAETIERIESFLNAITWDRIEANGPIFEVSEMHGDRLKRARIQAGAPRVDLADRRLDDGVIFTGDNYQLQAVICDHKIPSVAYALSFAREINVRKERLVDLGLVAGPWLGRLKACIAEDALDTRIQLPDGTNRSAGDLADTLTLIRPGKRLVYAADMADTPANRRNLTHLARDAHTLFCETAFMAADREKAAATQHLTTTAAMEIARAAGVKRLVPFHFSKRYEDDPARLYRELHALAGPVKIIGRL